MRTAIIIPSAAIAVLVAGCGSSAGNGTPQAAAPKSKPAVTATASTAADCSDQAIAWRTGGGLKDTTAIGRDLNAESEAGTAENLGALQAAATTLASDSETFMSDLPPACIPNVQVNVKTALNDFINASSDINGGSDSDLSAGTTEIQAGADAIERASSALQKFVSG
jgi:hypothetical protein